MLKSIINAVRNWNDNSKKVVEEHDYIKELKERRQATPPQFLTLCSAIENRDVETVRALVDKVDLNLHRIEPRNGRYALESLLEIAVRNAEDDPADPIITALIDAGAKVDDGFFINIHGEQNHLTPLMSAIYNGKVNLGRFLLEKGANPNHRIHTYGTAFQSAKLFAGYASERSRRMKGQFLEMADYLQTAQMFESAKRGDIKKFKVATDRIRILSLDSNGNNVGHIAAENGCLQILICAIDKYGLDVNSVGSGGMTSLMSAVRAGNIGMAKELLERGASVNLQDIDGNSPLTEAVSYNDNQMTELLLQYNVSSVQKNDQPVESFENTSSDVIKFENNSTEPELHEIEM